jgi:hypothetical protein
MISIHIKYGALDTDQERIHAMTTIEQTNPNAGFKRMANGDIDYRYYELYGRQLQSQATGAVLRKLGRTISAHLARLAS